MIKQLLMKFMTAGASTVSRAPSAASGPIVQGDLFPEPVRVPRFPLGAIVLQAWPWIGNYQTTYLYFQVRAYQTDLQARLARIRGNHQSWSPEKVQAECNRQMEEWRKQKEETIKREPKAAGQFREPDEYQYFCEAIPYGFRMAELNWFDEDYLIDTGLRWKIPSYEDLDRWCVKAHPYPKYSTVSAGMSELGGFTRWYLGTYQTPLNGTDKPVPEKIEQYHYDNKPFPEERELVRLLDSLDPAWPRWNEHILRENYGQMIHDFLKKKGHTA